ncbi:hypothetical protein GF327_10085 [Candidatus Woesearchaeota archaeon]|nr:hypothetical protein [Candidatus Woesearchaeota archaeon]
MTKLIPVNDINIRAFELDAIISLAREYSSDYDFDYTYPFQARDSLFEAMVTLLYDEELSLRMICEKLDSSTKESDPTEFEALINKISDSFKFFEKKNLWLYINGTISSERDLNGKVSIANLSDKDAYDRPIENNQFRYSIHIDQIEPNNTVSLEFNFERYGVVSESEVTPVVQEIQIPSISEFVRNQYRQYKEKEKEKNDKLLNMKIYPFKVLYDINHTFEQEQNLEQCVKVDFHFNFPENIDLSEYELEFRKDGYRTQVPLTEKKPMDHFKLKLPIGMYDVLVRDGNRKIVDYRSLDLLSPLKKDPTLFQKSINFDFRQKRSIGLF